jgi:hypothetical protein
MPRPQMIAPDEALPARADDIIPIVVPQLYGLVHPTATIAQVRCLRRPEVSAETLDVTLVTGRQRSRQRSGGRGDRGDRSAHNPRAFA